MNWDIEFRSAISVHKLSKILLRWGARVLRKRVVVEMNKILLAVAVVSLPGFFNSVVHFLSPSDSAEAAIGMRAVCRHSEARMSVAIQRSRKRRRDEHGGKEPKDTQGDPVRRKAPDVI